MAKERLDRSAWTDWLDGIALWDEWIREAPEYAIKRAYRLIRTFDKTLAGDVCQNVFSRLCEQSEAYTKCPVYTKRPAEMYWGQITPNARGQCYRPHGGFLSMLIGREVAETARKEFQGIRSRGGRGGSQRADEILGSLGCPWTDDMLGAGLQNEDQRMAIARAMGKLQLSQLQRDIMQGYYEEGLSDGELGERFGITANSVKGHRRTVRSWIKAELEYEGLSKEGLI